MLFQKKHPKKFRVRGAARSRKEPSSQEQDADKQNEEQERPRDEEQTDRREEIRDRIQFRSLRARRKTGARSLIWLAMLLFLVGALFWYLSSGM